MKNNKIYLAGAISGCSWSNISEWRADMSSVIYDASRGRWTCFDPCEHIPDSIVTHESFSMDDREAMNYDMYNLMRSDLMVVNFAFNPKSIGTIAEMGAAYSHQIPILGLNENKEELHPWQIAMCAKIFASYENLLTYIVNHYINE